jgi:nitrite reductase/ring-hydroxylating ferredoxin subunit
VISDAEPASRVVDFCDIGELVPGEIRVVELGDRPPVGVVSVGDTVRAFGLMCPHRGGPLQKGSIRHAVSSDAPGDMALECERAVLACPWHNWEYSLDTGRALFDPRRRLIVHEVDVAGGRVLLRLPQERSR